MAMVSKNNESEIVPLHAWVEIDTMGLAAGETVANTQLSLADAVYIF